jgi:type I restriction enzyme S subunit
MTDSRPNTVITAMSVVHPIEAFTVPSEAVLQSGCRLEGSYYGSDGYRAARSLFRSGFELNELGTHAIVRWFGPFSRTYVTDPARGIAFLSSSQIMEAKLEPEKYISTALTRDLARLLVKDGMILVSCSGTIGNVALCTSDFDGVAVSQHAIRVIPRDQESLGSLYAFLQSPAGQFLVKRSKSGSVVESIYENDVSTLLIPQLPRRLREHLTNVVREVSRLRVDANALLKMAEAAVQHQCDLPDLATLESSVKADSLSNACVFKTPSETAYRGGNLFGSVRLDATYYDPVAANLRGLILNSGGRELKEVVSNVRRSAMRSRVYVDQASQGVPLIGGKQMMQTRPSDINYISKALTRGLERERVHRGWTLVTCSGTLGRVQFVHRNFEEAVPSEHCMRIVPNEQEAKAGFIYAFLASPYGKVQFSQRAYGSVIPELRDFQFNSIAISVPPDRGEEIHRMVVNAFDHRADALALENEAIRLFEAAVEDGKQITEENWGTDY